MSSFQPSQSEGAASSTAVLTDEEDGVYYLLGGGVLCEILHRPYKQICCSSNYNLISIEISMLQAINSKDKSDTPQYLQSKL